jgi:hypothetical protein
MRLSTLQIMQHEMEGQWTGNDVDGSGPELFKPFECYVLCPQNTYVAECCKYSINPQHSLLTDLSQLVLVGKYHALPPMQGLKLPELSASHKILRKHGKFQISGNNNSNQSCIHEGIKEQFDIREYLPLFGPESFVF